MENEPTPRALSRRVGSLMALMIAFGYTRSRIERWEGATLITAIIVYLTLMMVYFTF